MIRDTNGVVSLQVRDFIALGTRGHLEHGEVPVLAPQHAPTYEVRVATLQSSLMQTEQLSRDFKRDAQWYGGLSLPETGGTH